MAYVSSQSPLHSMGGVKKTEGGEPENSLKAAGVCVVFQQKSEVPEKVNSQQQDVSTQQLMTRIRLRAFSFNTDAAYLYVHVTQEGCTLGMQTWYWCAMMSRFHPTASKLVAAAHVRLSTATHGDRSTTRPFDAWLAPKGVGARGSFEQYRTTQPHTSRQESAAKIISGE